MILNSVKVLSGISDEILLLSPVIIQTIQNLKNINLHDNIKTLSANEILIALSICAVTNPVAQLAIDNLSKLKGSQAHSTVILNRDEEQTLHKLGIDMTCEAVYPSENLYYV